MSLRIRDQIQITQDNYSEKRKTFIEDLQKQPAEVPSPTAEDSPDSINTTEKEKEDKTKAMSLLYSQPRIYMTPNRYTKLIEEITVVYYHEQRNEILTGHRNGSICIWN